MKLLNNKTCKKVTGNRLSNKPAVMTWTHCTNMKIPNKVGKMSLTGQPVCLFLMVGQVFIHSSGRTTFSHPFALSILVDKNNEQDSLTKTLVSHSTHYS